MAKPLEERHYFQYLKMVGWRLEKGSIDYKLYEDGHGHREKN